jgi:UDP-GlcNAc:undecaprenyl-phosphate GlcNAc-1-phosphate transferase
MGAVEFWSLFALSASASAFSVILVTPSISRLASRLGAMDAPGERRAHALATPRLGGLAIAVGALVGILVTAGAPGIARPGHQPLLAVFASTTAILFLGMADDLRQIRPTSKLLIEGFLAAGCWFGGVRVAGLDIFGVGLVNLPMPVSLLLTVGWIVGVTNAINLLDGLDGLAAGVVGIVSATLMMIGLIGGTDNLFLIFTCGV